MRLIGELDNEAFALTFSDALFVKGIENRIQEENGKWAIWVLAEEKLQKSKELLDLYRKNPEHKEFHQAAEKAYEIKMVEAKEATAYQKSMAAASKKISGVFESGTGRVTLSLILFSVFIALFSLLGENKAFLNPFFITEYDIAGDRIQWMPGLPEVFSGQIWRLITPIFIHFGIIHIFFNMWWLKSLGTVIEHREGRVYLGVMVLLIAALSNLGQYLLSGPSFGGMSGVVYGLLGYIWFRSKYDPGSGYHIDNFIVQFMVVWFFLGVTGIIGNIANGTHGIGLACGMTWGYISSRLRIK